MASDFDAARRRLLKTGVAVGGGLLVGVAMSARSNPAGHAAMAADTFAPDAWLRIGADDRIELLIDRSEMGQGTLTGLAMLVAEELEVDVNTIETRFAPAAPEYVNPLSGTQSTGGSTGIRAAWEPLRRAAASARGMLIAAAAQRWGVAPQTCRAQRGSVRHDATGRQARYGELASLAATLRPPGEVRLKAREDFAVIGKPTPCLDAPAKVSGRALYGVDVALPGMLVATIVRCPAFGGRLQSFSAEAARKVPGVRAVLEVPSGVAIVGDDNWSVLRGRELVQAQWSPGPNSELSSAAISAALGRAVDGPGEVLAQRGEVDTALSDATQVIEADYETPYLAHLPMEPMNCTAHVQANRCEVWVPTQAQTRAQQEAAQAAGLPQRAVTVNTTFIGGGFGRRLTNDYVGEAVRLSKAVKAPVQLVWSFADGLQHDHYRPTNYTRLRAALDDKGRVRAWQQRVAGPRRALGGIDIPYAIPHLRVEGVNRDPGVPTGPWRSVGASQNAFVVESFIDELAHAAGRDPLAFRLQLLNQAPRHRGVLELAAHKAGWNAARSTGGYQGIAVYYCYASWAATVIDVDRDLAVRRVVTAIDCGTAVNPETVAAQLEGAAVMGLSAALKESIQIRGGAVVQTSFADYPLLTLAEMPQVETHIVPSEAPPGGVGEPGLPPVAPALANAIFAATGRRLRRLPLQQALG